MPTQSAKPFKVVGTRTVIRVAIAIAILAAAGLWAIELAKRARDARALSHEVTKQAILSLASELEGITRTNELPKDEAELEAILQRRLPLDGWGHAVHYQHICTNRFKVWAISATLEALVFEYDSADISRQIKTYFF